MIIARKRIILTLRLLILVLRKRRKSPSFKESEKRGIESSPLFDHLETGQIMVNRIRTPGFSILEKRGLYCWLKFFSNPSFIKT